MDVEHLLPARAPRQRARQNRAIEKIDALVEATVRVLETEGEAGVRVAEICDQVGVSYGSVYHHFGDREGLIRAAQFARLRAQPGQDIASFASALNDDAASFVDSLMEICRSIASAERGPVREVRTSVLASTHGRPELRGPVDELETKVMDDLEEVVIRGARPRYRRSSGRPSGPRRLSRSGVVWTRPDRAHRPASLRGRSRFGHPPRIRGLHALLR
jgi:AcrR family transcriptional regulator